MLIRRYQSSDCGELSALCYDTVHTIKAKDYTREQLFAWASGNTDLEEWDRSLLEHESFVAVEGNQIIGFGDIDRNGYLDRLFVHKDYQRKGVATALCDVLEQAVLEKRIVTHASVTARPFFEKRGYRVIRKQQVLRCGIFLTNYIMEKEK